MNRLATEASPYLRQHADNPVDWWPWCEDAFAEAAQRDVPVLLSVGYSACHWCHVMAHESFEDPDVAAVMNELFVNIKVDREERPDVDAIYMEAIQALTGHGGWPMTVFLTPDQRPFFGGTYFPPETRSGLPGFVELCHAIASTWTDQRDDLLNQAERLTDSLGRMAHIAPSDDGLGPDPVAHTVEALAEQFDPEWGGFGRAPKFPQAMSVDVLCRRLAAVPDDHDAARMLDTTLAAMASGGIRDHLGGGYARYSVDAFWMVPHFEKMLYDQALIGRVFLHAFQLTGDLRWRQEISEMIDAVERELGEPDGGFASALDADSEGEEGKYYVWRPDEIRAVLSAAGLDEACADAAIAWWGVTESGNFEGANILHRPTRGDLLRPDTVETARLALLAHRATRIAPGRDDKVLTEWNGLWIATLAEAGAALGEQAWIDRAVAGGQFLWDNLRVDGRWRRSFQADAGARHHATSADVAAVIEAFIRLAEATGHPEWIERAVASADELCTRYLDEHQGGFWTTADDVTDLVVRPKDVLDNAVPSGQSMAATALLRLAAVDDDPRWRRHAEGALKAAGDPARRHPSAFAQLVAAADIAAQPTEVVIAGDAPDLVAVTLETYLPRATVAWGTPRDATVWHGRDADAGVAYVCSGFVCRQPVKDVGELRAELDVSRGRSNGLGE